MNNFHLHNCPVFNFLATPHIFIPVKQKSC
nr:MAG TPA: hypothetical protein [Caudoviricetes sp.]